MKHGFTLLEVLICLALAAILATLAVPAWQSVLERARRADAAAALYAVANAQERYRLVYGRYADAAAPAPPVGLGLATSERGWYGLRIERADEHGFVASARPGEGSPQRRDRDCRLLTIDQAGTRNSAPGPPERCWP
ncbi:MAG: type IV pilin protein [Gammaproteobacteria bacterium]